MKAICLIVLLSFMPHIWGQTKDRVPCVDKKFSVVAHIFKDTNGLENITEQEILDVYVGVNKDFAPVCISFEVCEFQYHDNFQYDEHEKGADWQEMQNLYHVKNRINVYYVQSINDPLGACGYASLKGIGQFFSQGIVIQKKGGCCASTSKTHSHEFGHYFGLEHTFMDAQTTELVDGSNCSSAADEVCDTPADPFINGTDMGTWVAGCRFISKVKDANDEYYDPLVGNIMSYYPDNCACGFTDDQLKKMAAVYLAKIGQW